MTSIPKPATIPANLIVAMWAAAGADDAGHYCAVNQIERAAQVAAAHYEAQIAELVEALEDEHTQRRLCVGKFRQAMGYLEAESSVAAKILAKHSVKAPTCPRCDSNRHRGMSSRCSDCALGGPV
jgi:hypothetical protein